MHSHSTSTPERTRGGASDDKSETSRNRPLVVGTRKRARTFSAIPGRSSRRTTHQQCTGILPASYLATCPPCHAGMAARALFPHHWLTTVVMSMEPPPGLFCLVPAPGNPSLLLNSLKPQTKLDSLCELWEEPANCGRSQDVKAQCGFVRQRWTYITREETIGHTAHPGYIFI